MVNATITENQVATLLGSADVVKVGYAWSITPVGAEPVRAHVGGGYNGSFTIWRESFAGRAA